MSPLAKAIYKLLVKKLRSGAVSLTYREVSAGLPAGLATHHRSSKLHAALGEITVACRAHAMPCLPAMVWRAGEGQPGNTYFKVAHPKLRAERARFEAWAREHELLLEHAARFEAVPW